MHTQPSALLQHHRDRMPLARGPIHHLRRNERLSPPGCQKKRVCGQPRIARLLPPGRQPHAIVKTQILCLGIAIHRQFVDSASASLPNTLTTQPQADYPKVKECDDSEHSGIRTRQTSGFFAPGPCVMAGRATDTTPRKGKEVHRLCSVINLPATPRDRVMTAPRGFQKLAQETVMTGTTLPATLDFDGTALEITDHNGAPWLTLSQIVRALGFDSDAGVQNLYTRNRAEFTEDMTALLRQGRTRVRIFSPRGAHLIGMFARTPKAKAFRRWVLDVLDHQHPPARAPVVKQSLTAPADPITEEVRAAIHAKAHALSLDAFQRNCATLEAWIRSHPGPDNPIAALERIHALDLDHGQYRLVNLQDLWALSTSLSELPRVHARLLDNLRRIEATAGYRLHPRSPA